MLHYNNLNERFLTLLDIEKFLINNNIGNLYPGINNSIIQLQKHILKIKSIGFGEKYSPKGDTKKNYRKQLANEASLLSKLVFAYAHATGNSSLKNAVRYSFSDFFRPVENTMLGRCRQVLNAAIKIKDGQKYAITPEILYSMQQSLQEYRNFMHTPKAQIKQHARDYKQVDKLLTLCLNIIHIEIEPSIYLTAKNNWELLTEYTTINKVKKTPGRKRKYVRKPKPIQTVQPMHITTCTPKPFLLTVPLKKIRNKPQHASTINSVL